MTQSTTRRAYRAGVAIAALTSLTTVWTTIVRDDGSGAGFFLVIMAAGVGAFVVWFRADGMARTMLGVAVMQLLFGIAVATAPITAATAGGPLKALMFNGTLAVAWLVSAACFRIASRQRREMPATV